MVDPIPPSSSPPPTVVCRRCLAARVVICYRFWLYILTDTTSPLARTWLRVYSIISIRTEGRQDGTERNGKHDKHNNRTDKKLISNGVNYIRQTAIYIYIFLNIIS